MNIKKIFITLAISPAFLLFGQSVQANPAYYSNTGVQNNQHTVPMKTPGQLPLPANPPMQQFMMMNPQQAKQIALQHAGFTERQVRSLRVERDHDDGRIEYEVDFKNGDYNYEYKINGNTGQIYSHKFEKRRLNLLGVFKSSNPQNLIQGEYAAQIALNHAGLQANQVVMGQFSYDFDDGEHLYDIEFYKDYIAYKYEIDAETGEIYQCEVDYHI